jgi:RNA polymerase sigma-70 factor (ECF subfamily)
VEVTDTIPKQRLVHMPLIGVDPRATQRELEGMVRDVAAGRPGAAEAALKVIRPIVLQYCNSRLPGHSQPYFSVEDVVQDVCLAVLKALPAYVDRGASFLHLVRVIASNKVADAYRAVSRDRSVLMAEVPDRFVVDNEPEWHALMTESRQRLTRLLSSLPAVHQEILVLRVERGFSAIETGEAVGLTPGNVRTIQQRALVRLRTLIMREGGW